MKATFTTGPRGPAIETPDYPALGVILSMDGNRPEAWFLIRFSEALQAVLAGDVPEYEVGQNEVSTSITPQRVEIVVSEMEDGSAAFRDSVPTQECADVVARWRAYLADPR